MPSATDLTPTQVVARTLQLLEAEDYASAAEFFHPLLLQYVVDSSWREARPPRRVPTVDRLLKMYPDMPREAAEYEVKQAENRPQQPSFSELPGIGTADELAALEPKQVLALRLQAGDLRLGFRDYLDQLTQKHPEYRDQLEQRKAALRYNWGGGPVGHVEDGDRAYVVMAGERDPQHEDHADVFHVGQVVLRRTESGWRISSEFGLSRGYGVHLHVEVKDAVGNTIVLS